MKKHECKRCSSHNEWAAFAERHPKDEHVHRDAPFAFAGYCSAICQALDLRSALIDAGMFNAETHILSVTPEAIAKAREIAHEDETLGYGYITRGRQV